MDDTVKAELDYALKRLYRLRNDCMRTIAVNPVLISSMEERSKIACKAVQLIDAELNSMKSKYTDAQWDRIEDCAEKYRWPVRDVDISENDFDKISKLLRESEDAVDEMMLLPEHICLLKHEHAFAQEKLNDVSEQIEQLTQGMSKEEKQKIKHACESSTPYWLLPDETPGWID